MKTIRAILLAAGRSRRFGQDKLVADITLNGITQPLLIHTLQAWLSVFEQITVVIGSHSTTLISLLQADDYHQRIKIVEAVDADQGLSKSLIAGVNAHSYALGWVFGLADMPLISANVIVESIRLLEHGAAITVPLYQQQQGHPVGFSNQYREALLNLQGDKGAKSILKSNVKNITFINVSDSGVCFDIDNQHDVAELYKRGELS